MAKKQATLNWENINQYATNNRTGDTSKKSAAINWENVGGYAQYGDSYVTTQELRRRKRKEEEERSQWFKSAEGTIGQKILGTALDYAENVGRGALSTYENVSDTARYMASDVLELFGADEKAEKIRKVADEDTTEAIFEDIYRIAQGDLAAEKDIEEIKKNAITNKNSILGMAGESVPQGVGTTAALATMSGYLGGALGGLDKASTAYKVSSAIVSGVPVYESAYGGARREARLSGATEWEARNYATLSGLIEAGTEAMFGALGSTADMFGAGETVWGKGGLDDKLINKLTSKINSTIGKNLVDLGIRAVGEGSEEVVAGLLNAWAQKLTYMSEEDINTLIKDQKIWDAFASAALSTVMSSGLGNANATIRGQEVSTGLSQHENAVIDRIAQQRAEASNITDQKQIEEIRRKTRDQMLNLEISPAEINETLKGMGENVGKYDYHIKQSAYNSLNQFEATDDDRLIDKAKLHNEVKYEDMEARIKTLEEDFSNLKLSDSTRNHKLFKEMTDLMATTGERIIPVTNETISENGSVEVLRDSKGNVVKDANGRSQLVNTATGKLVTVNGYHNKDGIVVNLDGGRAYEFTMGHELGEAIKANNSDAYNLLRQMAVNVGKADGTLTKETFQALRETYGKLEAEIGKEAATDSYLDEYVNDKIGELFGDNPSIMNELSKKPNLIRDILDGIKTLIKKFGKSDETKRLIDAQHNLEKALKQAVQNTNVTNNSANTRMSMDVIEGHSRQDIKNITTDYIKNILSEADVDADIVGIEIIGSRNRGMARDDSDLDIVVELSGEGLREDSLFDLLNDTEEPLEIEGIKVDINPILAEKSGTLDEFMARSDAYDREMYQAKYEGYFADGTDEQMPIAKRNVETNLERLRQQVKGQEELSKYSKDAVSEQLAFNRQQLMSIEAQYEELKKEFKKRGINFDDTKYSLSSDNKGRELTEDQQKYFKGTYAVDSLGNLKELYHGSQTAGFMEFVPQQGKGHYRFGKNTTVTYLTDSLETAQTYTPGSEIVDTRALESINDAKSWLKGIEGNEDISNSYINGLNWYYEDGALIKHYKNTADLLNNLKQDVQKEFGDTEAGGIYPLYAVIKNPYIVHNEPENKVNWNEVARDYGQDLKDFYNNMTKEQKTAVKSVLEWEDWSMFKDEISRYYNGKYVDGEDYASRGNTASYAGFEYNYENTLADIGKQLHDLYSPDAPEGSIAFKAFSDLSDIALGNYTKRVINARAYRQLSTNDIVNQVLEANANGANFDGVIFENIVDHGGWAGERVLNNVYVTFNGNQQKAVDNLHPTKSNDIRYSMSTDSQGRELTKEQAEFFKDSKVRDENGNLLVLYHGTPNGTTTEFKPGTYFTTMKQYADRYQNPSASSISYGKEINNPATYEVYLNMTNPFDTKNNQEARRIFEEEFFGKWGNSSPLTESGYPDWVEGIDLQEFIEENHPEYDGLILDEGGEGGYGQEVISRGISYVTMSPNQVKNIDNLSPTSNPDIRYSLDNQGNQLSEQQTEYFKDSKMRDENGNLEVMYHGTPYAGFTVFDSKNNGTGGDEGYFGEGFYFTNSQQAAAEYSDADFLDASEDQEAPGEYGRAEVKEVYLDIKNPYIVTEDQVPYDYGAFERYLGTENPYKSTRKLQEEGYDGVIYRFNSGLIETTVFEPNQIKNITNQNPSKNEDIRYSMTVAEANTGEDNRGFPLSDGMKEYMADSKATDENGNLITVYHTTGGIDVPMSNGVQFNVFDPTGTEHYRFGDQVVVYFSDNPTVSGSYMDQDFRLADTSRIDNMDQAQGVLDYYNSSDMIEWELRENNGAYDLVDVRDNENVIHTFQDQNDLFRNIREVIERDSGLAGYDGEGIQYEGYLNITNPYIVDGDFSNWDHLNPEVITSKKEEFDRITEKPDAKYELIRLADKSKQYRNDYLASEQYRKYNTYKEVYERIKNKELSEAIEYTAMFGGDYESWLNAGKSNAELFGNEYTQTLPDGNELIVNYISGGKEGTPYYMDGMTINDFVKEYGKYYEYDSKYSFDYSWFQDQLEKTLGTKLNTEKLSVEELYGMADKAFTNEIVNEHLNRFYTTNDIVKQVLEMNKNGANYDGVIFQNIYDSGGEGGRDASNVYAVFNSNQFKASDNIAPTADPDIRYSLADYIDPDTERFTTPFGVEVVKNPSDDEYRSMRNYLLDEYSWLRGTDTPMLRHTYDEEGNEYYWSSHDGVHADVEPYINQRYNTRTNQNYEWWKKANKNDYPTDYSYMNLDNTRYSMQSDKKYGDYWEVETNKDIFKGITNEKELSHKALEFIKNGNKNFDIQDGLNNGDTIRFIGKLSGEYVYGTNSQKLNQEQLNNKMRLAPSIDDLINNATIKYKSPYNEHGSNNSYLFKENGYDNFQGNVGIDGNIFSYIVKIGVDPNESSLFYDVSLKYLGNIKGTNTKTHDTKSASSIKNVSVPFNDDNISQTGDNVKFSLDNADIHTYSTGAYSGQVNMVKEIRDANDDTIAKVDYAIYDGKAYIDMIEVNDEYRRQGLATKLIDDLREEFGDNIEWGYTTPEGTKFKNAYNERRGTNYSLSDSNGRKLSDQQAEFFRNVSPELKNEKGQLIPMYHGSNSDFTVFDISKGGQSNSNASVGFWFTPSKQGAENFANDVWYGDNDAPTVYETYLNIRNPKVYETYDNTVETERLRAERDRAYKAYKDLAEKYAYDTVSLSTVGQFINYRGEAETLRGLIEDFKIKEDKAKQIMEDRKLYDKYYEEYRDLEQQLEDSHYTDAYEQFRTDIYKLAGKRASDANTGGVGMWLDNKADYDRMYVEQLKEQGYDGIVIKNTRYDANNMGQNNTQYVVFEPNQIKNVDNLNPTLDPDIRYSLSEKTQQAIDELGTTDDFREAGYLTTDGQLIDFSGKKFGARGGDRTMDHRDIGQAYTDEQYTAAEEKYPNMGTATAVMQDFLDEGNIRLMPEQGVDITLEPTEAQYDKLYDYIEFLKDRLDEIYLDLETETNNRENLEYNNKIATQKIINDIKKHYDNSQFSLSNPDEVFPLDPYRRNITRDDITYMPEIAPVSEEQKLANYRDIITPDRRDRDIMEMVDNEGSRKSNTRNQPPQIRKEKGTVRKFVDTILGTTVNRNVETDNLSRDSGNRNIKFFADMLNNVAGEVEGDMYMAQTNINGEAIGKAVDQLFQPARAEGLEAAFNDYLINYSNIDRYKNGKGSQTPLDVSKRLVRDYSIQYPQFKEWAKDVWQWGKNARQNLVDAGLIDQELANYLGDLYPHYVPYVSDYDNADTYFEGVGELKPRALKSARGGAGKLLPVEDAISRYTYVQKKAIRQNQLYSEIVKTLGQVPSFGIDERTDYTDMRDSLYSDSRGNYLTAYENGQQITTQVSTDLYNELNRRLESQVKELENNLALITKPLQKASEIRRNVITTWNPTFIFNNALKDFQNALVNSKNTGEWLKQYPGALKDLITMKAADARQFVGAYGSGMTMGDFANDAINEATKGIKGLKWIKNANEIVELAPRLAEFRASIKNGASFQEAMYNAREVTLNFGRGGTIAKALNRNGFTFLNASIQGFDKMIRNFSGENGAKGIVAMLAKVAALGIVPAIFNEIAFGTGDDKDEEYDALPDYIKDNYFLIKTSEDGNFIRIPKGQMLAVFGSAARRTLEAANGEEDAYEGFLSNSWNQVGFNNPADNNIFAPLIQAFGSENGEAWYGGDIVPTRLQDKPTSEQYDENTDKFSIWLGDKTGISPYKINYLLDQYGGGFADVLLPMGTEAATSEADSVLDYAIAPMVDKFTANSTTDNKYVSDFYSKRDEITKQANSYNATDEDLLEKKYMDHISTEMSDLYKQRREIQSDNSLSKSEKYEKAQEIKRQINELAKIGLSGYENVDLTGDYAVIDDDMGYYKDANGKWKAVSQDDIYTTEGLGLTDIEKSNYYSAKNDISEVKDQYKNIDDSDGRERAIAKAIKAANIPDEAKVSLYTQTYKDDMAKYYVELGMKADDYLDYKIQNFKADKDANGKSISGSKKQKVIDYVNQMNIALPLKAMLIKQEYSSFNNYNREIIDYLNLNPNVDYETMKEILEKLGFKIDSNGRVTW